MTSSQPDNPDSDQATSTAATPSGDASYNDILKSTSIVGGSQAVNYLIGMVRTKLIAIILGPAGIGLIGNFVSTTTLVMQLTGLGIGSSGVRQIAEAQGSGNTERIGKTVRVLRRVCWVTGIVGWLVTALLARPLSVWVFASPDRAWLVAILGATLLLTAISGGQRAIIQGTRRIADLAKMTVLASLLSTIVGVSIYALYGENGIIPVLISTAAINLSVSWWFARKIDVPESGSLTLKETFRESKELTHLGVAFMWGGILAALVDLGIRALIVRNGGLHGTGIYDAAWALSGLFANFILNAMGADFYPRLTAVADDHPTVNSMVNEQIEIGNLIALPGLLGTLALGPVLMTLFYSKEFIAGAELLPWFILGIFCRVISWPLGYTILAKGASKWYFLTQTHFYLVQIILVWILISYLGLIGIGIAFFITFIPAGILNLLIAHRLTGFRWSRSVIKLITVSALTITVSFLLANFLPVRWNLCIGTTITIISAVICTREIVKRVGPQHRISRMLIKIPGAAWLLPR